MGGPHQGGACGTCGVWQSHQRVHSCVRWRPLHLPAGAPPHPTSPNLTACSLVPPTVFSHPPCMEGAPLARCICAPFFGTRHGAAMEFHGIKPRRWCSSQRCASPQPGRTTPPSSSRGLLATAAVTAAAPSTPRSSPCMPSPPPPPPPPPPPRTMPPPSFHSRPTRRSPPPSCTGACAHTRVHRQGCCLSVVG